MQVQIKNEEGKVTKVDLMTSQVKNILNLVNEETLISVEKVGKGYKRLLFKGTKINGLIMVYEGMELNYLGVIV